MKKILLSVLALISATTMFAQSIDADVTITLESQGGSGSISELYMFCGSYFATTPERGSFMPTASNPEDINVYAIDPINGNRYSSFGDETLVNIPLGIITSKEEEAKQTYKLKFDVYENTITLKLKDLLTGTEVDIVDGDSYSFTISSDPTSPNYTPGYTEGSYSTIANRFVINYQYVNLNGDFDNPNGGGAWIWINDFVEHGQTATKEYTLPADAWCHFKVVESGVDYADSFDFDESNKSHQFTTPGWSEELTLHTAEAGVYTFTWNYITNTLTIDFPAPVPTTSVTTNAYGFCSFASNEAVEFLGGLKAYKGIFNASTFELTLEEIGTKVPAGEGVILWNSNETAETFYYNVGVDASAADMSGNNFVGAIAATPVAGISADAIYCLHGNELMKYVGTEDIPAGKAYLPVTVSGSNPAPKHIVMRFNNTTAVDNVEAGAEAVKFVEDGQILIRRGNEVYNLQGQIVK